MFGLDLREKNVFEVQAKTGEPLLGSERQQRKAIADIYPIIRDEVSIFFESKNFSDNTPPGEFLYQILSWFSTTTSCDWQLVEQGDSYYIVQQHIMKEDVDFMVFDADFMPTLRELDENFYRAMCFALKCLEEMDVELWDSHWEEMAFDFYDNADESEIEDFDEIKKLVEEYRTGEPQKVLKDVRSKTGESKEWWIKMAAQLNTYQLDSLVMLKDFIMQVIALSMSGSRISDFYNGHKINEYYSEDALAPFSWIRVAWNRDDRLYEHYVSPYLNDLANNYCLAPMVQYVSSDEESFPLLSPSTFPSEIIRVMDIGEKAVCQFYRDDRDNRIKQIIDHKQLQAAAVACGV